MSDNPLEITEFLDKETGESRMYVPLDVLPEEMVEELRAKFLKLNSVDSTAEELGPSAPGVKDDTATEQAKELMQEAMSAPIDEDRIAEKGDGGPTSPADALG